MTYSPEDHFAPLPEGFGSDPVTGGKFIDVEILGTLTGNDIISSNWDGSVPVNLSSGPDSDATVGYALDASVGVLQTSQIFTSAGGPSAPSVSYSKDKRTGMYFYISGGASDGAIGFSIQGTSRGMSMDPTSGMSLGGMPLTLPGNSGNHMIYRNLPTAQTGTTAVLYSNGSTYDLVPQSSTRRHKKNITDRPQLADIELRPRRFQRKGRDNWEYGLIVEDLIEQDETLGIYDPHPDVRAFNDYDTRAVLAVLVAKVNRLESRRP